MRVPLDTAATNGYVPCTDTRWANTGARTSCMNVTLIILEAILVYLFVLAAHSLRFRTGLGPFFALLGGLTAIMSWVTDAGIMVQAGGITFVVGSTVFYTALLLGVFVLYVFEGPQHMRLAILTVAAMSALTPLVAAVLHAQMSMVQAVPTPGLRINTASVLTTAADFVFLAMAWEFLGRLNHRMRMWPRVYLTLLGVLWFDVLLFSTGAFGGTPEHLSIMTGTLASRFIVSLIAGPILFIYVDRQSRKPGIVLEDRPVLAILRQVQQTRAELSIAQQEIERRTLAEARLAEANTQLRNLTARLHVAREQERAEVGLELHDDIAQTLAAIKMDLSIVRKRIDAGDAAEAHSGLDEIVRLLDETVGRIRRLYTDLRPGMLDDLGLAATIEWQASEFANRTGIRCHVGQLDDVALKDREALLAIYRVFQEALENIARHSGATRVNVSAEQGEGHITIRVSDNGWGIREEDLTSPDSTGLTDMRERVRPFGGSVEITGAPGRGTTVLVRMPVD